MRRGQSAELSTAGRRQAFCPGAERAATPAGSRAARLMSSSVARGQGVVYTAGTRMWCPAHRGVQGRCLCFLLPSLRLTLRLREVVPRRGRPCHPEGWRSRASVCVRELTGWAWSPREPGWETQNPVSTKPCLWGSWHFCLRVPAWAYPSHPPPPPPLIPRWSRAPACGFIHPGSGVSLFLRQNRGQLPVAAGAPGKGLPSGHHSVPPT